MIYNQLLETYRKQLAVSGKAETFPYAGCVDLASDRLNTDDAMEIRTQSERMAQKLEEESLDDMVFLYSICGG